MSIEILKSLNELSNACAGLTKSLNKPLNWCDICCMRMTQFNYYYFPFCQFKQNSKVQNRVYFS